MTVLTAIGKSFLDFLPLLIFLQIAGHSTASGAAKWMFAFEVAGIVSVLHIAFLIIRSAVANRIALAVDMYLLVGGVASFFSLHSIISLLNSSRECGVLVAICVVGIVTTVFSSAGFVGYRAHKPAVYTCSIYLLLVTGAAASVSFVWIGHALLAGVLPVLSIVMVNKLLLMRLQKSTPADVLSNKD